MNPTPRPRSEPPPHLAAFHGREPLPADRPLLVVHGNCQAESLRLALTGPDLESVRIPPVHELSAAELPQLRRVLRRASVLVTQPVRRDYRGLPVGSEQIAGWLPPGALQVRVPVIRFAGLYPTHAIIRPPSDRSLVPPLAAYHDLSVLAEAADLPAARTGRSPTPRAVLAVAEASLGELRAREQAHDTVVVSDLFTRPNFGQMRTLNHPGNAVWAPLADRVRARLGLSDGPALKRSLLDAVHAPRLAAVVEAFGLQDAPRSHWIVDGRRLDADTVREAHLAFYRAHPDAVAEGLRRHAHTLRTLLAR